MRRILIVDDQPLSFADEIQANVLDEDGNAPHLLHINPLDFLANGGRATETVSRMLQRISEVATEFWDVVAIDLWLGDFHHIEKENLEIPLQIAESFRSMNQSATMLLYSGTLSEYLNKLFGTGASDNQLRRVFRADISNFVARRMVAREIASDAENPSWILRVDRLLMRHSAMVIGPQEAEFTGRSLADLAMAVRRQDPDGQRVAHLTAEYGIAAIVDLNQ